MAKRKISSDDKSKPFTTINIYLPTKISICGNVETQKKWNNFFKRKNAPKKDEFIMENFRKDLGVKTNADIFDDPDFRRWDKKKIEDVMLELRYPNIQEYINFILERALEEKKEEKNDEG